MPQFLLAGFAGSRCIVFNGANDQGEELETQIFTMLVLNHLRIAKNNIKNISVNFIKTLIFFGKSSIDESSAVNVWMALPC